MEKQEFTVTGPGEYRTRDGRKAVVARISNGGTWPARGTIEGQPDSECWRLSGGWEVAEDAESPTDIVGPWIEPATLNAAREGVDAEVAASVAGAIETFTADEEAELAAMPAPEVEPERPAIELKSVEAYAVETIERVGARIEERFGAAEGRPVNAPTEHLDWPAVLIADADNVADPDAEEEPTDYRECAEVLAAALRVLVDAVDASIPRGAHGLKIEDARRLATVALDGFAP